jgi:hypothetical protein
LGHQDVDNLIDILDRRRPRPKQQDAAGTQTNGDLGPAIAVLRNATQQSAERRDQELLIRFYEDCVVAEGRTRLVDEEGRNVRPFGSVVTHADVVLSSQAAYTAQRVSGMYSANVRGLFALLTLTELDEDSLRAAIAKEFIGIKLAETDIGLLAQGLTAIQTCFGLPRRSRALAYCDIVAAQLWGEFVERGPRPELNDVQQRFGLLLEECRALALALPPSGKAREQ